MNWIWYNRDSYSNIPSEESTCYLLTEREKTGKIDVPGGLDMDELLYVGLIAMWVEDKSLKYPERRHIGVEVYRIRRQIWERNGYAISLPYHSTLGSISQKR